MSIIAALLILSAVPPPVVTAEQAMAASRARTGIGADPCRGARSAEEIVVCGRRENPYALPLHDPMAGQNASDAGDGREAKMRAVDKRSGACAMQGWGCLPPPAFNGGTLLGVLIKGIKAATDGE